MNNEELIAIWNMIICAKYPVIMEKKKKAELWLTEKCQHPLNIFLVEHSSDRVRQGYQSSLVLRS